MHTHIHANLHTQAHTHTHTHSCTTGVRPASDIYEDRNSAGTASVQLIVKETCEHRRGDRA